MPDFHWNDNSGQSSRR